MRENANLRQVKLLYDWDPAYKDQIEINLPGALI